MYSLASQATPIITDSLLSELEVESSNLLLDAAINSQKAVWRELAATAQRAYSQNQVAYLESLETLRVANAQKVCEERENGKDNKCSDTSKRCSHIGKNVEQEDANY